MVLNWKAVTRTLGGLLLFLGVALVLPALVGLYYGEVSWWSFAAAAGLALGIGGAVWATLGGPGQMNNDTDDLGVREGFAIVALSWFVLSLIGALPFVLSGVLDTYTDAFFETMSGFTTTGATIFGGGGNMAIEAMPNAFLFWRSLAHWMGGMGIIVLTLAILPILGVGGMQLFRAEVPGPSADKLTPRVRETAKRLWLIYVGITAIEVLLLLPAMTPFDAVNHAFATMATGGFSTENGSVGQYGSAYIDWVITVFMFLAGVNFALHYRMLRGQPITVFRDTELRVYTAIVGVGTAVIALGTWQPTATVVAGEAMGAAFEGYTSLLDALRYGAFQTVAIVTTTGFGTADYEVWPPLALGALFILFFVGGMAGSTGGGPKVVRHVLLFKNAVRELKQLVHPQAIIPMRLGGEVVPNDVMRNVLSFIVLYFMLNGFGIVIMSILGMDLMSAFGATIASVGNIGPGFGSVGPTDNYAHIPAVGKWVLALMMMAGRLEIFTVLILLMPTFWRR
ncbi:MAG: TrkH family potassium uptake protein [Bacteroidetes bacterium]|jgi:trk system potassium uptake protein TrkH|nr:TrkH family potassium uptake protein [Bacteroidota bacterium]